MTTEAELLDLTRERINGYMHTADAGGRNGPIVRQIGRLANVLPGEAYQMAEDFEPGLRASALTAIGKASEDIGPVVEAKDIIDGIDLDRKARSRKLYGVVKASTAIDPEFALDVAREIKWVDLKVSGILRVFDEYDQPRPDLLWEAFHSLEDDRKPRNEMFSLFQIAERAKDTDLGLTEKIYDKTGAEKNDMKYSTHAAVKRAIKNGDSWLLSNGKDVVVRVLETVVSEYEEHKWLDGYSINPLEDAAKVLRLTFEHPELDERLVAVISRAAKALAESKSGRPIQVGENVAFGAIFTEPLEI